MMGFILTATEQDSLQTCKNKIQLRAKKIKKGQKCRKQTYFSSVTYLKSIINLGCSPGAVFAIITDNQCSVRDWNHRSGFYERSEHICYVYCNGDQPVILDNRDTEL